MSASIQTAAHTQYYSSAGFPESQARAMAHYRIYTVGADRHIVGVVDIEAADDLEASGKAQGLVNGLDVELWQRTRFIARFPSFARRDGD
jgi:hypothetical protein